MERNVALDGLRGYAAFAVVFYHAILGFDESLIRRVLYIPIQQITLGYDSATKIALSLFNGEIAVLVFFILSGAVLFEGLQRFPEKSFLSTVLQFCTKRFFRIYPALIACMALFFITRGLCQYCWPEAFPESYPSFLWIQNTLLQVFTIHGASWTLKVEMLVIPFILMVNYAFRFIGITALFLFLAYSLAARFYPALTFDWGFVNDNLPYFALGFLLPTNFGKRLFALLRRINWIFFAIALLSIKLFMNGENIFTLYCQGLISFFLVGIVYHHHSSYFYTFLEKKHSQFFGKISYSFYLLNVIFLKLMQGGASILLPSTMHYLEYGFLMGVTIIFFTVPLATLFQRYIEQPFMKLGETMISSSAIITSSMRSGAWRPRSEIT